MIIVSVSSPGPASDTVQIAVKEQEPTAADFSTKWCSQQPKW